MVRFTPRCGGAEECRVGDFWGTFEWGAGGMTHPHAVAWMTGSPRMDAVGRADDRGRMPEDVEPEPVAVRRLADFFNPLYAEWNAGKASAGEEGRAGARSRARHARIEKHSRTPAGRTGSRSRRF